MNSFLTRLRKKKEEILSEQMDMFYDFLPDCDYLENNEDLKEEVEEIEKVLESKNAGYIEKIETLYEFNLEWFPDSIEEEEQKALEKSMRKAEHCVRNDKAFRNEYLTTLKELKKEEGELYKKLIKEQFGKVLPWEEIERLDTEVIMAFSINLRDNIRFADSSLDYKKLSIAIQKSRSGTVGGAAMTRFECKLCEQSELWGSTATPDVCKDCAENMAKNIILRKFDILKS